MLQEGPQCDALVGRAPTLKAVQQWGADLRDSQNKPELPLSPKKCPIGVSTDRRKA